MFTDCFSGQCLGDFVFSHKGYFKGFISKGVKSDENDCACTCREDKKCIAYDFQGTSKNCFVYEDVSNLNEKIDEANTNAYIKDNIGNNYLSVLPCQI